MIKNVIIISVLIFLFFSCSLKSEKKDINRVSSYSEENEEENLNDCKFEDNTYSATVDYYNPETSYSATYTLYVEVEDCQIVQIDFPNDGYLDDDHISYADIDEDGTSVVYGEDGKTYNIQMDY